jgi:hypothetical protein
MFTDDDAARHALHTLNDDPAPPVATSLDQVLRRGRRRVFTQRVSAVAGAVAVVAAIGATAILLRGSEDAGGDRVQVAATTSATPTEPTTVWETQPVDAETCKQNPLHNVPGKPPESLLPKSVVEPAFTDAIVDVAHPNLVPLSADWQEYSPKVNGPRGYIAVEIPMGDDYGQLQLEAAVFPGTPTQVADASLYAYGDCKAPSRRTLVDGTIMQLFQADRRDPEQPSQHLQIYRPDGRMYIVTAAGWGEQDYVPAAGGGHFIVGGRGELPVTEQQLVAIAETMVTRLG